MPLPKVNGPRLVALASGELVSSDSEAWRHECEARSLVRMGYTANAWLHDIERLRGPAVADALWKTMEQLRALGR